MRRSSKAGRERVQKKKKRARPYFLIRARGTLAVVICRFHELPFPRPARVSPAFALFFSLPIFLSFSFSLFSLSLSLSRSILFSFFFFVSSFIPVAAARSLYPASHRAITSVPTLNQSTVILDSQMVISVNNRASTIRTASNPIVNGWKWLSPEDVVDWFALSICEYGARWLMTGVF